MLPVTEPILTPDVPLFRNHASSHQFSAISQNKLKTINHLNHDRPALAGLKDPSGYK
jgi:hypothetical protein